ncbi:hypothetical protein, partial [Nocardiopsis tropica]
LMRRLTLSGGNRAAAELRDTREAIVEYLTVKPHTNQTDIEDDLRKDGFTRADIRAALKQAVAAGQLSAQPGPRRSHLHTVNEAWRPPGATAPTPGQKRPREGNESAAAPSEEIGLNSVSAGRVQYASAPSTSGLKSHGANPVRQAHGALKPQVTEPVRQTAASAPAQSEPVRQCAPLKGGGALAHSSGSSETPPANPTPPADPTPLGSAGGPRRVVLIDGRYIDATTGARLTRDGDHIINPENGELYGNADELTAARHA